MRSTRSRRSAERRRKSDTGRARVNGCSHAPSPRRPRPDQSLSLHALAADRLPLPPSADLLGICRRGARPLRPVGRRLDDARAADALPAVGHVRHRPRAGGSAARRALVRAVAFRALVVAHDLSKTGPLRDALACASTSSRFTASPEPSSAAFAYHAFAFRGVGHDAEHGELAEHRDVVGRAERERGTRIARFRGAREQQPPARDVALRDQILAAPVEDRDLVLIERAARRARRAAARPTAGARLAAPPGWRRFAPRAPGSARRARPAASRQSAPRAAPRPPARAQARSPARARSCR